MGEAPVDPPPWALPMALTWAAPPDHVGLADVTSAGGGHRATAVGHRLTSSAAGLPGRGAGPGGLGPTTAQGHGRGRPPRGNCTWRWPTLHHLAGWTSFDVGMIGPARRHSVAGIGTPPGSLDEKSLVAKVLYALGRVHLHHGWPGQALRRCS